MVSTGVIWNRLFLRQDLATTSEEFCGPLDPSSLWQVRIAESVTAFAMIGAVVTLGVQMAKGSPLDGMSGIDIDMCRAIQQDLS